MPSPAAAPAPRTVTVQVTRQGNQLVCIPNEVHVHRGDTVVWTGPAQGPAHTGRFDRKLHEPGHPDRRPARRNNFSKGDLTAGIAHHGPRPHPPSGPRTWANGEHVAIGTDSEFGVYSYTVGIDLPGGQRIESDPFVIIEDPLENP